MPTVLIVEDNPDHRRVLSMTLEGQGIHVLAAADGRQGLQLAREHQPDVLLVDIAMPHLDGLELCRQLKADSTTESIPVVMVTALYGPDERKGALEAGAAGFLSKPFEPDDVVRIVNENLPQT